MSFLYKYQQGTFVFAFVIVYMGLLVLDKHLFVSYCTMTYGTTNGDTNGDTTRS